MSYRRTDDFIDGCGAGGAVVAWREQANTMNNGRNTTRNGSSPIWQVPEQALFTRFWVAPYVPANELLGTLYQNSRTMNAPAGHRLNVPEPAAQ